MNGKKGSIHDGHRERMRERLLNSNINSFQDHELLEMLLYYIQPRGDNEKAHKLLREFGSLDMIINANLDDLQRRCGLSHKASVFFVIIRETLRRFDKERWKPKKLIDSSDIAGEYGKFLLSHEKVECFYVIALDSQSRLISAELISMGTVNETHVYTRSIIEAVIKCNARTVILAHNHPGGSLIPTKSDVETTVNIIKALNMIDVFVADHIIVAGNEYLSMSDKGLIENL